MNTIKKILNIDTVTGSSITIPILFTQKSDIIGHSSDMSNIMSVNKSTVTVTGITNNKLDSVRSFDYNTPYKVGSNGVSEVTSDYIKYNITGIEYQTDLKSLDTIFRFTTDREEYTHSNLIHEEFNLGYVDKTEVFDMVEIERQGISVIESVSKLRQITIVEEIEVFGNKFYKINNQTI